MGQPKLGGPAHYPQRLKLRLIEFGFTSRLKAATFQIQSHLHLQIQSHPHLQIQLHFELSNPVAANPVAFSPIAEERLSRLSARPLYDDEMAEKAGL